MFEKEMTFFQLDFSTQSELFKKLSKSSDCPEKAVPLKSRFFFWACKLGYETAALKL